MKKVTDKVKIGETLIEVKPVEKISKNTCFLDI